MTGPGWGMNALRVKSAPEGPIRLDAEDEALADAVGAESFATTSLYEFFKARKPYVNYLGMRALSAKAPKNDPRLRDLREKYLRARNGLLHAAMGTSRPFAGGMSIKESEQYRTKVAKALLDGEQKRISAQDPAFDSIEPLMREEELTRAYGTRLSGEYPVESADGLENMLDEFADKPKLMGVAADLGEKDAKKFFAMRQASYAARFAKAAQDPDPSEREKVRAYETGRNAALGRLSDSARTALVRADAALDALVNMRERSGAVRKLRIRSTALAEDVPTPRPPVPPPAPPPPTPPVAPEEVPLPPPPTPAPPAAPEDMARDDVPPPAPKAPARRAITLADDPDELERVLSSERSVPPDKVVAPRGTKREDLAAALAEGGVEAVVEHPLEREDTRPRMTVRLERGSSGKPVVKDADGMEHSVAFRRNVLPYDTVAVVKAEGGKAEFEVKEILERYPHRTVALARLEQVPGKGQELVIYPDNRVVGKSFTLPPEFVDVSAAEKGLRIEILRNEDPTTDEWTLVTVIGEAGKTVVEQDAMAYRTPNGPKRVEELTEADIRRYAERIDKNKFPLLKAQFEKLDFAELTKQIAELNALAADVESGKVSTDELAARFLPLYEAGAPLYTDTLEGYEHGKNRVDRREVPMLVMDPKDAKDHDDGLLFHELSDKRIEVGVPIASPESFFPEGSPLDLIAQFREMTQYLPKTLPLLPESLANVLGSLKEGEDRLSLMMFLTYPPRSEWPDPNTPPTPEVRFAHAAVKSHKFVTYDEGQKLLDAPEGDEWGDRVKFFNMLAQSFERSRNSESMSSRQELRFEFDDDSEPTGVHEYPIRPAHKLIEHFAVTANLEAAKALANAAPGAVVMIRAHAPPSAEKMSAFLDTVGYGNLWKEQYLAEPEEDDEEAKLTSEGAHALMKAIRTRLDAESDERVRIQNEHLLVRAMMRAGYALATEETLGEEEHFGLALRYYGHYTSPIRRYPDIIQHRLLDRMLAGNPVLAGSPEAARYAEIALLATEREKGIDEAGRDMNEFLALKLFENGLAEVSARPDGPDIEAEMVLQEKYGGLIRLTLPGPEKIPFDARIRRNDVRDAGGEKLSTADWEMLGKTRGTIPFDVLSVDPTRRKIFLQVDTDAVYNRHGLERLKAFAEGTELMAEIDSVDEATGTAHARIRTKNNQVLLKRYEVPLERIGLSEENRASIAASLARGERKKPFLLFKVGAIDPKNGLPFLKLEQTFLPKGPRRPAQTREDKVLSLAQRFLEQYRDPKGKERQKVLHARVLKAWDAESSKNTVTVALEAKNAPKSYVIRREDITGITDEAWKALRAGETLDLLVDGIVSGNKALKLIVFRKGVPLDAEGNPKEKRKKRRRKRKGK